MAPQMFRVVSVNSSPPFIYLLVQPRAERTSFIVSFAVVRAFAHPSPMISSSCAGLFKSSFRFCKGFSMNWLIFFTKIILQSMHPMPAVRHPASTCTISSALEKKSRDQTYVSVKMITPGKQFTLIDMNLETPIIPAPQ